jgi:gliding motility-associated-like protein
MRIKNLTLLCAVLFFSIAKGYTQPCTNLGQNPGSAFPVCGTATFVQNNVPICGGTTVIAPCATNLRDLNPFWYRFTCYIGGTLGFLITPNNLADDYDWQLFDITGKNANNVYTDASMFVSCNWSGFPGVTGASTAGTSLINCEGNVPIFSSMPTLIVGHEYILLISHFTPSQSGYRLSFTMGVPNGGTASITDPANPIPAVTTASSNCDGTQITVHFNKKVKCSSLAVNGSDFIISPSGTIGSVNGNCGSGFDFDSVVLTLTAPLPPGPYVVRAALGTDANTLLDNCDQPVVVGDDATFIVTVPPPLPMGTVTPPPCTPNSIILNFIDPVRCASVAPDGSDFIITGPSAVTVISATSCNALGETNSITIQFAGPILTTGTYQVQMTNGADGNTIIGQCSRLVAIGALAPFTLAAQPAIAMGTITQPPCTPSSLTITFNEPINCNSIAANGSDFIVTGPSAVTVNSATAVNCNASGQATSITIQLAAPIMVSGSYSVQMAAGADGNTLVGNCGKIVNTGTTAPFTLAPQPAIPMGAITPPPCIPTSLTIAFNDPINCNSIAANGSDFIITGPSAVTVNGATPVNCNASGQATSITIQLAAPIMVSGSYLVQIAAGNDGNTLVGDCGKIVNAGNTTPFTLAAQPAIAMGIITPPSCIPSSITLTFAEPVNCNSIAANGSDFTVTGPSAVTVTGATPVNCNANGETTTITLQFLAPVVTIGTYQAQVMTGSDGNTITGQCGKIVTAGSSNPFTLAPQPPVAMGTVVAPNCSPSSITLNFADNIVCASIAANGSDFIITGASPVTIISATATCNANGETNAITLQLANPIIVSGPYQIQLVSGSDGNTLLAKCNRQAAAGITAPFTIPPASPVPMGNIDPVGCSPTSLKLIFSGPIRCTSIAANGSDFIVTGPSAITVASASGNCDANGLTTGITIQLASPIVAGGTYFVQLTTGSDGNTLLSDCNRPTAAGSVSFVASDTVSAEFQYQIQYDCENDVIDFSHDGQHNVNQWTWTINGATASTSQIFSKSFSAASQNQVQLVVSNGVCNDTYSTAIVLNNKVTVAFDGPDTVCPEDTVTFINNSSGPIITWQWNFGNGNNSVSQIPPVQTYPLTGTESLYTVTLTAGSNQCQATATKTIKVLSSCIIAVPTAFTPNNDGLNDYLFPLNALKAENLDFKVFNRWGQMVFHSRDWTQKWDGRINGVMQATNVYVWTLNFIHKDTRVKYSMRGTSTLIR